MTTLELLRGARSIIADKARWTYSTCARTKDDRTASGVWAEDAAKWCAIGAIYKTRGNLGLSEPLSDPLTRDAASQLERDCGLSIWVFNDAKGHAATLATFDKTIRRLETEQLEQISVVEHEHEREAVLA